VDLMRNVPVLLHILIWYMVFLVLPGPADAIQFGDWLILSNRGIFLPGWVIDNSGLVLQFPVVDGLEILAGISMSPEYAAVLIGIGTYTAAFVAEIFRGAIISVPKGQWEAGHAIGLQRRAVFRKIVFPQAARAALPPLTSEYLGIVKNSSLAVAIGYQDLIGVGNSVLFETGQAIEVIGLIVVFYIIISLLVSFAMELVSRKAALKER
jgi:general L-amino acid transport system permease protein